MNMSGASGSNIILLTGGPGCGKTTLVQKVYQSLIASGVKVEGFYTEETRREGQRSGFDVVLLNEAGRGSLARVETSIVGPKVGKYTVDLKSFESLVLPRLVPENLKCCQVLILDEIGKMELLSKSFETAVRRTFGTSQVILATVPTRRSALVEQLVKAQTTDSLILVHNKNRDSLALDLKNKLLHKIKL